MRVVVTGAGGSLGGETVEALANQDEVSEVVGLGRCHTASASKKTSWVEDDIAGSPLERIFDRADAVVHLAWTVQPSHNAAALKGINVGGIREVFEAATDAGVSKLIFASSAGAYQPGPRDRFVDEDWPIGGIETSPYSRFKAKTESVLNELEEQAPALSVVRMRPALVVRAEATREIRRLFTGALLPDFLVRRGHVPAIPSLPGFCLQAVHTTDLARAFALATTHDVGGAFNLAADPPLDSDGVAKTLRARTFPLPHSVARQLAELSWRMRIQPMSPGWIDMALKLPLISSDRAARELDWHPRTSSTATLAELLRDAEPRPNALRYVKRGEIERRLIVRLEDIHGIELQGIAQLRHAIDLVDSNLGEILAGHLVETEAQERRVREQLAVIDPDPSSSPARTRSVAAGIFATNRARNAADVIALVFAAQHLEIAAYESLLEAAEAAGDEEVTTLATEILLEERAMVERLAVSFDAVVEASLNGGGKTTEALIDRYLTTAHAIEREGLHLLETAPRIVTDPTLKGVFAEHLGESGRHEAIVRERLEARGVATARAENAPLRLVGSQLGAQLVAQPDTTARLVGFARAYDHLKIAAYELLSRVARHAGDDKVLATAERILAEEQAAARRLTSRGGSR